MDPERISRYELHAPLGQGGMGTVYRARDPSMDRWVAVKTISVQDASQRARFQREVRAAGSLNHPHITTIYDVGEKGDLAFIVMELVEGETLASRLAAPVPWPEAVELLLPICDALAYAHSRGVIHRDVKPANILVSTEGQVKLTDFGVARLEAALRRITESGSTVGTPLYTAPEQIENKAVDGRADLFSLGIVLFELMTGQHPFAGETLAQVIHQIMHTPADLKPLAPSAPPALVELVRRALNKDPAARFSDADEMAAALRSVLEQPETATMPPPSTPSTPTPTPSPLSQSDFASPSLVIDPVASNISLSAAEEALLRLAFAGYDRLFLEKEFSSGFSEARVLLVTPVRSGGKRLAQLVLKIDRPAAIDAEWRAYQKYVKDTLPPVTARILEEPLQAGDGQLALLRYTFAGGLGQTLPESLRTYYTQHNGPQVARVLEKNLFEAFGEKWWLQRQTTDLILRREYDRLLPVHLKLEYNDVAEATATPHILSAGNVNARTCGQFEPGQLVQLQNFKVEEVRPDQNELTLRAWPPSGSRNNPIRVRIIGLPPHQATYRVGQTVASLDGVVTANQLGLLHQFAREALPNQDLTREQLTIGDWLYPNPLYDYESLLDQHISVMESIIHGDLNLENILVTPSTDIAWLIDFATTRRGHNLYDFMRLEVQVITKLLSQTQANPEDVANLIYALHNRSLADQKVDPELEKPFAVLTAIRRRVRVCMYSRENWDEYYLGLVITLLGALKFKELEPPTRALTLAAAAAARSLIEKPDLRKPRVALHAKASLPIVTRKITIGVISAIVLAILTSLGILIWGSNPPTPTPTPQSAASPASVATSIPTPATLLVSISTPTLLPPTLTPVPPFTEGIVVNAAEIFSGPATVYPTIGPASNGSRIQITGRSADDRWLQVRHPGGSGGYGWMLGQAIALIETVTPPVVTAGPPPPLPTFTLTPEAPTACPPPTLYPTLSDNFPTLSCAVASRYSDFTLQTFEHGLMVWRKTPAQIFVIDDSGEWRAYEDPKGPPEASCPEGQLNGELGPIFSFGIIWCDEEIDHLGAPLTKETALEDSPVEEFEQGIVFTLDQTVYILFENGQWRTILPKPTPSPTAEPCSSGPAPEFEGVWQHYRSELGCPTRGITVIPLIAEELFEGGTMFWRSDTDEVYIVYDRLSDGTTLLEGEWENPSWKWDGSNPDGLGMVPPAGRVEPSRGFGWLWRTHLGGPNSRLGWALDIEHGFENTGRTQAFEKGIVFKGSGATVYALLDDGHFFASDSGPGNPAPAPKPSNNNTGFLPDDLFNPFWEQLGGGGSPLGYPLGAAITERNYARQRFERGLMFWWESPQNPQPIWVLYAAGPGATQGDAWQRFDNNWLQGQPEYPPDCPEAGPPWGPKSGFGLVWCYEGVKTKIGQPVEAEFGSGNTFPTGRVQFFQNGVMLENPADQEVWALIDDDGWYRFSY